MGQGRARRLDIPADKGPAGASEKKGARQMAEGERGKVYLTFHRSFVREHIGYTDALTGEERARDRVRPDRVSARLHVVGDLPQ